MGAANAVAALRAKRRVGIEKVFILADSGDVYSDERIVCLFAETMVLVSGLLDRGTRPPLYTLLQCSDLAGSVTAKSCPPFLSPVRCCSGQDEPFEGLFLMPRSSWPSARSHPVRERRRCAPRFARVS